MEKITANINEIQEKITANIKEGIQTIIYPTPSYYDINFSTNDTAGIYSKFDGQITEVELTNVSSYKIDGNIVTLPFTVEFSRTYLIEIVKTDPLLDASISFKTNYIYFTKRLDLPDFKIGNGKKTYLLYTAANMIDVVDNTILTVANTTGVGTWAANPIIATINLPITPFGGWYKLVLVKSGKLLVLGSSNGTGKDAYFCYIDDNNNVTDLNGNSGYSVYTLNLPFTISGTRIIAYNYIDNVVYFFNSTGIYVNKINLNNNTSEYIGQVNAFNILANSQKVFFNPYKSIFLDKQNIDLENLKQLEYLYNNYNDDKKIFNINTGQYIAFSQHKLAVMNEYGQLLARYTTSGTSYYKSYNAQINYDNNVVVFSTNNNLFAIYRINELNGKEFAITNPDITDDLYNGMYAYDDLFLITASGGKRLQCIDASDPLGTVQPDFNYLDLPNTIDDMYTNRLL